MRRWPNQRIFDAITNRGSHQVRHRQTRLRQRRHFDSEDFAFETVAVGIADDQSVKQKRLVLLAHFTMSLVAMRDCASMESPYTGRKSSGITASFISILSRRTNASIVTIETGCAGSASGTRRRHRRARPIADLNLFEAVGGEVR